MEPANRNELKVWRNKNEIHFSATGNIGRPIGIVLLIILNFMLYPFILLNHLIYGNNSRLNINSFSNEKENSKKPLTVVISQAGDVTSQNTFKDKLAFKTKLVISNAYKDASISIENDDYKFLGEVGAKRIPYDLDLPMEAVEIWLFDINDFTRLSVGTIQFVDTVKSASNYLRFMKNTLVSAPDPLKTDYLEANVSILDIKYANNDPVNGDPISVQLEIVVIPISK